VNPETNYQIRLIGSVKFCYFCKKDETMIPEADYGLLKAAIRNVPDFPTPGIQFKDITTVIKQPEHLALIVNDLAYHFRHMGITRVVAIESRGFLTGGALACKLGAGLVPVRKPGKLPAATYSVSYDLEYGKDTLEIHQDALHEDDIVLLHDDLLATGGTALAAIHLLRNFNIHRFYAGFIAELDFIHGRQKLLPYTEVFSLIHL
jgi:adenine phosphoribosyltransferase